MAISSDGQYTLTIMFLLHLAHQLYLLLTDASLRKSSHVLELEAAVKMLKRQVAELDTVSSFVDCALKRRQLVLKEKQLEALESGHTLLFSPSWPVSIGVKCTFHFINTVILLWSHSFSCIADIPAHFMFWQDASSSIDCMPSILWALCANAFASASSSAAGLCVKVLLVLWAERAGRFQQQQQQQQQQQLGKGSRAHESR